MTLYGLKATVRSITYLGNGPRDKEWCVLGVGQHSLGSVEEAEVGSTVDDDALDGHSESTVQSREAIGFEDLAEAVSKTSEFTLSGLSDVGGKSGTGEVKGVHEAEGGGTGSTTRGKITGKVAPELGMFVHTTKEHLSRKDGQRNS
jgi:hypothetical protein